MSSIIQNLNKSPQLDISLANQLDLRKWLIQSEHSLCISPLLENDICNLIDNDMPNGFKTVKVYLRKRDKKDFLLQITNELAKHMELYIPKITSLKQSLFNCFFDSEKQCTVDDEWEEFINNIERCSQKIILAIINYYEVEDGFDDDDYNRFFYLHKLNNIRFIILSDGNLRERQTLIGRFQKQFKIINKNNLTEISMRKSIPVYVSYNWETRSDKVVDEICTHFQGVNSVEIIRDKDKCRYKDNIKQFMDDIRRGMVAILVLSDEYLKSENCMNEMSGLFADDSYIERVFPILVDTSFRNEDVYLDVCRSWEKRKLELSEKIRDPRNNAAYVGELSEILLKIEEFTTRLPKLYRFCKDINSSDLETLKAERYESVVNKVSERVKQIQDNSEEVEQPEKQNSTNQYIANANASGAIAIGHVENLTIGKTKR